MTSLALVSQLRRRLRPAQQRLLAACRRHATDRGESLYLVGGAVRDLLRPDGRAAAPLDLDLALDGDTALLARTVTDAIGARALIHERFLTVTLTLGADQLDLARTRSERYPRSAALPVVRPAPIEEDLARRDFSVNAMALTLDPHRAERLLDPFEGRADLAAGRIRILRPNAFRDDPTRLIRACRYAARLDSRLTLATTRALRRDLLFLQRLSSERFAAAWRALLLDHASADALALALRLGLSEARLAGWRPPPRLPRAYAALAPRGEADTFWTLTGLTERDARIVAQLPQRCRLQRDERRALSAGQRLRALRPQLARVDLHASRAAALLRPLPPATLEAAATLWSGRARARVQCDLREWRTIQPPLTAERLLALGVPRGPQLRAWLDTIRDAQIDGRLPVGRAAAKAAAQWVQSGQAAPARPASTRGHRPRDHRTRH